ncbi:hypothetical protein EBBID32_11790 [Sphingobium indicum BiD32]|uniref:Uncharacterized protein n=1 Tax=Sphingobium indicum BiD32 TaxID=1301087 RepID=N1MIR0_9SPHN|nr:hypothetical protein EBBID32_11790 [Sphingobium indicum BiD32]
MATTSSVGAETGAEAVTQNPYGAGKTGRRLYRRARSHATAGD